MEILILILLIGGILLARYLYIKKLPLRISAFINERDNLRRENARLKAKNAELTLTIQNQNEHINRRNGPTVFGSIPYHSSTSFTSPPYFGTSTQYEER